MSAPSSNDISVLLLQVAEGDEAAFRRLANEYYNKLGAYVLKITGSFPLTQEIVQDILLKVWQHRDKMASIERFDTWLFVIARNHTYNCLTQISRDQRRRAQWEMEIMAEEQETKEAETENERYHLLLEKAIIQLPPRQREVYTLHRKEGIALTAIADRLGLSQETVKKHKIRAVRNIRIFLREHLPLFLFFFK